MKKLMKTNSPNSTISFHTCPSAKQKKQELRVHACFVNSQSNVNKMIITLQQKVHFALNEFKREKRLKENARKILSMNESFNLDDECVTDDKTDSEFFNECQSLVDRLYNKMNGESNANKLKDDLSINSSERLNFESANTSKSSTLDSKHITRNPSQGSLNSIKSKSSTSSRKSINYDSNLMSVRRQFLVKGLKNFKEPIERSRSAPKLSSISEEFLSSDDDEIYFDSKYLTNNNNFLNYYNICEEEPDDDEIIRELGLITGPELSEEIINENDKTLTEFNENVHYYDQEFKRLSPTIYEEEVNEPVDESSLNDQHINHIEINHSDQTNSDCYSDEDKTIESSVCNGNLTNGTLNNNTLCNGKLDSRSSSDKDSIEKVINIANECTVDHKQTNQSTEQHQLRSDPSAPTTNNSDELNDKRMNDNQSNEQSNDSDNQLNQLNHLNETKQPKDTYVYNTCQSPQFIIFKRTNSFNNRECDLHAKQIVENCKLIEDLVLNF